VVNILQKVKKVKFKNEQGAKARAKQQNDQFCMRPFYKKKISVFDKNEHVVETKRPAANPGATTIIFI